MNTPDVIKSPAAPNRGSLKRVVLRLQRLEHQLQEMEQHKSKLARVLSGIKKEYDDTEMSCVIISSEIEKINSLRTPELSDPAHRTGRLQLNHESRVR